MLIGVGLLLQPAPDVGPPAPPDPAKPSASSGWIAYSTAPAADYKGVSGDAEPLAGSDIYLVREGEEPRLIADRDGGGIWNVCPAFSPDGSLLAFGQETSDGEAIVVVGIDAQGSLTDPNIRLPVAGSGLAPCPRWSSDGSRVAYLEGGTVVVRELDGSSAAIKDGDPALADFAHNRNSIPAPNGELVARNVGATIVVERADGSDSQIVAQLGAYALAGWSPDSRWILSMQDVSGFHFTMHATSVVEPFETVTIVAMVRVNHGRSWPGDGDVSWQPTFGE
jgi:Tol biopolymer transport system component